MKFKVVKHKRILLDLRINAYKTSFTTITLVCYFLLCYLLKSVIFSSFVMR